MRSLPLFLAACIASAQTTAPQDPKAIVEYLYTHPDRVYTTRDEGSLSARFFSLRLRNLYLQDRKNAPDGYASNLDFDFLSNSQDPEISGVSTRTGSLSATRQTVTVYFLEMKKPQVLEYDFIRQDGVWRINEVRCPMKGREWVLSQILAGKS